MNLIRFFLFIETICIYQPSQDTLGEWDLLRMCVCVCVQQSDHRAVPRGSGSRR